MTIRVKFFAMARDAAGSAERMIDVPPNSTIAVIVNRLIEDQPTLEPVLQRCAFAVNLTMATRSTPLIDDDEVAILPPVSGG